MSFLDQLTGYVGSVGIYAIPFVLVLSLVVFVHELGHFLVGRWCGVRIQAFSIGFGPELLGWTDRHGTRWKISAIPLGGYVKFFGDAGAASTPDTDLLSQMGPEERRQSFFHQPLRNRAAIVAAGPIFNFLLAIAIFSVVFMTVGRSMTEARIDQVIAGSPAEAAGLKPGDVVTEIDGRKIDDFNDLQRIVTASGGRTLDIRVTREGAPLAFSVTPVVRERSDGLGSTIKTPMLGIQRTPGAGEVRVERLGPVDAVVAGTKETWFVVENTLGYIGRLFVGRESIDQLSGPIRIAQVSGEAAKIGWQVVVSLAALLSVSVGLINLFPIPILDGGHLLFYAIEAIRGRPLSERAQELGFRVGMAIVMLLMVVTAWNDILHLNWL